jgi:hypothetical protein
MPYFDIVTVGTTVAVASTAVTQQSPAYQYSAQRVYVVYESATVFFATGTAVAFVATFTNSPIPGVL